MAALVIALLEDKKQSLMISNCVREAGNDVLLVENFSTAKAVLLQQGPFDLILSDVHLQNGGNVFDFRKWVKSDLLLKSIPFVLLSVEPTEMAKFLSEGVRVASRHFGAAKYIGMQEFDSVTLMAELSEFLP